MAATKGTSTTAKGSAGSKRTTRAKAKGSTNSKAAATGQEKQEADPAVEKAKAEAVKDIKGVQEVKDVISLGDYEILIEGTPDSAIAKVIRNEDEVILDHEFTPMQLPEVAGHTKMIDAIHYAKMEAIAAYHKAIGTVDGLVDADALIEHPYNSLIYGENEPVADLLDLLNSKDGQVFELLINDRGQVLAGNRRLKAAQIINRQCQEKGEQPKYQFLPIKVTVFDSVEAEFKYMILHNRSRRKTKAQLAAEAKALIALSESSATPKSQRLTSPELVEALQDMTGFGRATVFKAKKAIAAVQGYKDVTFRKQIEEYALTVPKKAEDLVKSSPPVKDIPLEDYHKMLFKHVKQYPTKSIPSAKSFIDREILATRVINNQPIGEVGTSQEGQDSTTATVSSGEGTGGSTATGEAEEGEGNGQGQGDETASQNGLGDILTAMKLAGDKPTDNRKTPIKFINLCMDAMGNIDLDSFAMLSDPEYIPASKGYSILDDAFSKPHEGNVFANPPFSRASEAIALFNDEICNSHTKKLFLILPASVQSTKAYHKFLQTHNPLVLVPNERLSFEPGELLMMEDPQASASGNREPSVILFWSSDDKDYPEFYDSAQGYGWVGRRYAPFNPFQLPGIFSAIEWKKTDNSEFANVFGMSVEVTEDQEVKEKDDNAYRFVVDGNSDGNAYPTKQAAKYVAIMTAISFLAPATPF